MRAPPSYMPPGPRCAREHPHKRHAPQPRTTSPWPWTQPTAPLAGFAGCPRVTTEWHRRVGRGVPHRGKTRAAGESSASTRPKPCRAWPVVNMAVWPEERPCLIHEIAVSRSKSVETIRGYTNYRVLHCQPLPDLTRVLIACRGSWSSGTKNEKSQKWLLNL
jgi:hypothetical protein